VLRLELEFNRRAGLSAAAAGKERTYGEIRVKLALNVINIENMRFGDRTEIQGRELVVDREELMQLLSEDQRLERVELELAHPGESCRILQIAEIIEPRAKIEGGGDFPGAISPIAPAGMGKTCVLRGTAITISDQSDAAELAQAEDALGLILDMSGPAADIHLYGGLHHLVVIPHRAPGVSRDGYRVALKLAGLKAAAYLARAGRELRPDRVESYELPPLAVPSESGNGLPRIAYIYMVHCTSYPAMPGEPILYGDNIRLLLPTIVHPNEILDGAVVNPYDGIGTETYVIQNHPVISELYTRHGKTLSFAGVVLIVSRVTEPERERSAMLAANAARYVLGADGVILTKASSGAPDIDIAQTAQACEDLGMKAVLIVFDRSNKGEIGEVFDLPGARSIVTTANQYEVLRLPAVERVIGKRVTLPSGQPCDGELEKSFRFIRGGLDQVGITRIRSLRY
jgi:glycine reductase